MSGWRVKWWSAIAYNYVRRIYVGVSYDNRKLPGLRVPSLAQSVYYYFFLLMLSFPAQKITVWLRETIASGGLASTMCVVPSRSSQIWRGSSPGTTLEINDEYSCMRLGIRNRRITVYSLMHCIHSSIYHYGAYSPPP